jgi:hypothetical protein
MQYYGPLLADLETTFGDWDKDEPKKLEKQQSSEVDFGNSNKANRQKRIDFLATSKNEQHFDLTKELRGIRKNYDEAVKTSATAHDDR